MPTAIVIPALNPNERLAALVAGLRRMCSCPIVLVDDGSDEACRAIFDRLKAEYGCLVARHPKNRGKGAALKTGIRAAMVSIPALSGVVTADADGQHLAEDIVSLAEAIALHPRSLLLGVRGFSRRNTPLHNLLGNRITSLVFYFCTKFVCADTQTGLRGIPAGLLDECMDVPGDRYEYEMNVLCELTRKGVPFCMLPISTVYADGNSASHFRVVRDSFRIYRNIFRYGLASLLSAGADLSLFALLSAFTFTRTGVGILAATAIARCISGVLNFTLNRNWSFRSDGNPRVQAGQYALLFVVQMLLSAGLVTLLSASSTPLVAIKILVDCALFVISYFVQKRLIFTKSQR